MSSPTIKEIKSNSSKLCNSLNIELIKGDKGDINKGEHLIKRPIDLSNKNKCMAYCSQLPFGILSHSSYIDLEKMKIVFSVVEQNEYKLLGAKSKKMVNILKLLRMPLFIGFLKIWREKHKTFFNDDILAEELLKYIVLNKKK